MKPKNWLSDLAKGMFFLPESPSREVPGIIVSRGDRLRLELIGTFSDDEAAGLTFQSRRYPLICGWLSQGGPITLVSCSGSETFNAPGMSTEQISFAVAIKGHRFNAQDDLHFDSICVHFSDLSTWIGASGLHTEIELTDSLTKKIVWKARYEQPKSLCFSMLNGATLKIHFTASFPASSGAGDVALKQECLVASSGESLDKLRSRAYHLQLLIKLLSGYKIQATFDSVKQCEIVEGGKPVAMPLYLNRKDGTDAEANRPHFADALVPFAEISDVLQRCIDKWMDIIAIYGDAVLVSLADVSGLPLQTRLLNLVNSLQRYSEADLGKKVVISAVLPKMLGPYCSSTVTDRAVDLIESSRHYFTHFNPTFSDRAASGAELANLVDLLDLVNRCALLERLDFKPVQIKDWVSKSLRFKDHLSMDRWSNIN